jgi:hypothetical protein
MISAWDCFHYATLELVRSSPIKQRLVCAYQRHLSSLPAEQLPSEIRESFEQVMRSLRGVQPQRGEDAVTASVRKMSNREADDCAALIVEIFGLMCKSHLNATRSSTVVQLHSVECAPNEFEAPVLIASN